MRADRRGIARYIAQGNRQLARRQARRGRALRWALALGVILVGYTAAFLAMR